MSRFWKRASLLSCFLLSACYSEFRSVSISWSPSPLLSDPGFGFLHGTADKHCNWVMLWLQFLLVSFWQAISWTCAMEGTAVEPGTLSSLPIRRGWSLYQVKETKLSGSLYWEEANAHLKNQTREGRVSLPLCSRRKLVLQLQWVHIQSTEEVEESVEEIEISRYPKGQ